MQTLKHSEVYIGGRWMDTGQRMDVVNPATEEVFASVSTIGLEHIQKALENATDAFAGWRALTARERGGFLHRVADELHRRQEEIAGIITLENGKPLAQSMGEVNMSEDHFRWFAEEGKRAYGRLIPFQRPGNRNFTVKTPIGVVGAITPWNFPLVLAARKAAPALAAGCPVILKPASQTPLSSIALAECFEAAGVPPGVFQLVIGNAPMIAQELLTNPICRKISFTGSTEVGQKLIRGAAESVKPLSLELGGLAPLLVFEDCDLDRAVEQTLIAKFRNTGQSCIAANRIYVQRPIHQEFLARFLDGVRKLKTAGGFEPKVDVGPLINRKAIDAALGQVSDAIDQGAKLLCGGKRMAGKGYFLEPAVLDQAAETMLCMREETFAPVAPLSVFDTEEEAIHLANSSPYGLSAYAMTRDAARVFRLAEQVEAGTIGINDGAPSTSQSPFGGVKQSGWGRELGMEGLDAFLETKHVSLGGV